MTAIFYRPPIRQYLMEGDFFVGAAMATVLTKLALRYIASTQSVKRQNVSALILPVIVIA